MPANKSLMTWGLLGKVEATYGIDAAPVAGTDGLLTLERPQFQLDYLFDGERGNAPGTGGRAPAAAPGGREASLQVVQEAIGGGAAYSATVKPSVDAMLRAAGFISTLDATVSSEKYTYTTQATPSAMDSLTVWAYERGQLFKAVGCYAESMIVAVDGPGIPSWDFPIKGIGSVLPTDIALPAITYPAASNLPPKFEDVSLSVNSITDLVLRSFNFDLGREVSQRADGNATTGHAGFQPGMRAPTLELVIEADALSNFNPYSLREGTTLIPITFGWGTAQYKQLDFTFANCRITDVSEDEDGSSAIWTIQFQVSTSDYVTSDDIVIVFD